MLGEQLTGDLVANRWDQVKPVKVKKIRNNDGIVLSGNTGTMIAMSSNRDNFMPYLIRWDKDVGFDFEAENAPRGSYTFEAGNCLQVVDRCPMEVKHVGFQKTTR